MFISCVAGCHGKPREHQGQKAFTRAAQTDLCGDIGTGDASDAEPVLPYREFVRRLQKAWQDQFKRQGGVVYAKG